jgi:hypothetical protein
MNYFNKYRVVFWIMIVMILVNISAFTTYFFYYRANRAVIADTVSCSGTCRFLNEQLGLSPGQSGKVSEINRKFREQTEPLVAEIKNTRAAMLNELASGTPDTGKINKFAEKIGELQKTLQRAAIVQFQQLKQVCTPEQCFKLSAIYFDVYGCRKMGQDTGKNCCPKNP